MKCDTWIRSLPKTYLLNNQVECKSKCDTHDCSSLIITVSRYDVIVYLMLALHRTYEILKVAYHIPEYHDILFLTVLNFIFLDGDRL